MAQVGFVVVKDALANALAAAKVPISVTREWMLDSGCGHDLVANRLPANGQKKILFRPLTSAVLNMSKYLPALLLST